MFTSHLSIAVSNVNSYLGLFTAIIFNITHHFNEFNHKLNVKSSYYVNLKVILHENLWKVNKMNV